VVEKINKTLMELVQQGSVSPESVQVSSDGETNSCCYSTREMRCSAMYDTVASTVTNIRTKTWDTVYMVL
jgi:hypothetical protein